MKPARPLHRLLALSLLPLLCNACITLPIRSAWASGEPPVNGGDGPWAKADESIVDGVRVKVLNNATDVYVALSTDKRTVQSQFSGRFDQTLTFWFGARPEGHGISLSFTPRDLPTDLPQPSTLPDHTVTLLGPADEGLPRLWREGTQSLIIDQRLSFGTMTWFLKVPLQAQQPGGFALHADPSRELPISIETSALGLRAADKPQNAPDMDTSGSGNPALSGMMAGLNGMGGGGRHGRRHGGGDGPGYGGSSVPEQPFVQAVRVKLAKLPLAGH